MSPVWNGSSIIQIHFIRLLPKTSNAIHSHGDFFPHNYFVRMPSTSFFNRLLFLRQPLYSHPWIYVCIQRPFFSKQLQQLRITIEFSNWNTEILYVYMHYVTLTEMEFELRDPSASWELGSEVCATAPSLLSLKTMCCGTLEYCLKCSSLCMTQVAQNHQQNPNPPDCLIASDSLWNIIG